MKGETKIGTMADWTLEERAAKEKEWRQALFTLRLQKATGQLDNPMKIKSLRRDIARLKTLASRAGAIRSTSTATAGTTATAATAAPSSGGGDALAVEPAAGSEVKAPEAKPVKKAAPATTRVSKAPARKPASKAKPGAKAKAKAKAKA